MKDVRDPALEAAIRAVPGWSELVVEHGPLGGTTNRNVRVDVDGEPFVVRLFEGEASLLGIDREAEVAAARSAAAAGVGPEVVAWLPDRGAMVSRFVTGRPLAAEDLRDGPLLAAVVGTLRAFHACPPLRTSFDVFRVVERYRRLAADRGVPSPAAALEARGTIDRIEAALHRAPVAPVPCHNELMGENVVIDDGRVWLLDYEYAGMGDPFFDLGDLAAANDLPEADEGSLLSAYLGEVTDGARARLGLMRIVSEFREAAWALVQQAISPLAIDFAGHADAALARCLNQAADPRLADWLDAVAADSVAGRMPEGRSAKHPG
jgi:thiamine kinase-like enzyme